MDANSARVVDGSDDDARHLLEELLRLRRDSERDPNDAKFPAAGAVVLAKLIEAAGGWAVRQYVDEVRTDDFVRLPPEERRSAIAAYVGLPLMPASAARELKQALIDLNAGQVDPLLVPTDAARRGAQRFLTAQIQLELLCWLRWRKGRGYNLTKSTEILAAQVHSSRDSPAQWKRSLDKLFGKDVVRCKLEEAERAGRVCRTLPEPVLIHGSYSIDANASLEGLPKELRQEPGLLRVHLLLSRLSLRAAGQRLDAALTDTYTKTR